MEGGNCLKREGRGRGVGRGSRGGDETQSVHHLKTLEGNDSDS